MDPQWDLIRLAACFFIAWTLIFAYVAGKILACLESIAKSLRAQREEGRPKQSYVIDVAACLKREEGKP